MKIKKKYMPFKKKASIFRLVIYSKKLRVKTEILVNALSRYIELGTIPSGGIYLRISIILKSKAKFLI